jgi:SAM-dependent methyltransferase
VSEPGRELRIDNPLLVRWEFASEERLATRNAIYRQLVEGDNAEDFVFDAVARAQPKTVLEVGCGAGELAYRLVHELGVKLVALDASERMVALTRERGVDARVGDVLSLPFEDGQFDCVVAAWVFYHVAQRDKAIAECARVLRSGGSLVAAAPGEDNLEEMWALLGATSYPTVSFSSSNGAEQLARHFASVELHEARGAYEFPNPEAMRRFVAADMTRAHLSANVPAFEEPVRAQSHHTVFVAEKA